MGFSGGLQVGFYLILTVLVALVCFLILLLTYIQLKRQKQPNGKRKNKTSLVAPPRGLKENVEFFVPPSVETIPLLVQDSIHERENEEPKPTEEIDPEILPPSQRKSGWSEYQPAVVSHETDTAHAHSAFKSKHRLYKKQRSISLDSIPQHLPLQQQDLSLRFVKKKPCSSLELHTADDQPSCFKPQRSKSLLHLFTEGSFKKRSSSSPPKVENPEKRRIVKKRPFSDIFTSTEVVQPPGTNRVEGSIDKRATIRRRMTETNLETVASQSLAEHDHFHNIKSSIVSSVQTSPGRQLAMRRISYSKRESRLPGKPYTNPLLIKSAVPKSIKTQSCISFSLAYSQVENKFEVHLLNATDLPMKDNILVDSYATISFVSPTKKHRRETKVFKKTCNPIFDVKYVFRGINQLDLPKSFVQFKVHRRLSSLKSELIGKLVVELAKEDMLQKKLLTRCLDTNLKECSSKMQISLCHKATSSELILTITEISGLKEHFLSVPRISVDLIRRSTTLVRQTRPKVTCCEPFTFFVATDSSRTLEAFKLLIKVYYQDIIRGEVIIGFVILAADAPLQTEIDHWSAVTSSPHQQITRWHKLHK